MASDLVMRPAAPEDRDQILDLLRISLGVGEGQIVSDPAYWTWKHFRNPFGVSPCLVAELGGRIVGFRTFMRWCWSVRGRDVAAVRAVDTATHPDVRGKGIFSKLTLALLEEMKRQSVAFIFNTPNRSSMPGYLKMGWVPVGRVTVWVRPVRWGRLARRLVARGSLAAPETGVAAQGTLTSAGVGALLDSPEFCALWNKQQDQSPRLATSRSLKYLRWRYSDIPGFTYAAAWRVEGEDAAAVIFRHKQQGNLRELRVCEVLIGRTARSAGLARHLLRRLARSDGVDYIGAMAGPQSPEEQALLGAGFIPAPRVGPTMTVRTLGIGHLRLDPRDRSNWRLSIGDLEVF